MRPVQSLDPNSLNLTYLKGMPSNPRQEARLLPFGNLEALCHPEKNVKTRDHFIYKDTPINVNIYLFTMSVRQYAGATDMM